MKKVKMKKTVKSTNGRIWTAPNPLLGEATQKPLNHVELMATWCDTFELLFGITWLCAVLSAIIHGKEPIIAAIGIMIVVGVSWILGGIVVNLFRAYKETLGGLPPVYRNSYSVFAEGPRAAIRRLAGQIFRQDYCTCLTACCTILILAGDILCLFDLRLLLLSIVVGTVLSIGGFFAISLRLLFDTIRERCLMRQIF